MNRLEAMRAAYAYDVWSRPGVDGAWVSVGSFCLNTRGVDWIWHEEPRPGSFASRDELAAAIRAEIKATETRTAGSGVRLSTTDITYPAPYIDIAAPPLPVRPVDDSLPDGTLTYAELQAIRRKLEANSTPSSMSHRLPPPTREEWTADVVAAMGKQNPYPWAPLEARRHVDMALDWLNETLAGIIGVANGWETSGDRRDHE